MYSVSSQSLPSVELFITEIRIIRGISADFDPSDEKIDIVSAPVYTSQVNTRTGSFSNNLTCLRVQNLKLVCP